VGRVDPGLRIAAAAASRSRSPGGDGIDHFHLARRLEPRLRGGSEQTDDEWKELREEFDELEYATRHHLTELWTLDLESCGRQAGRRHPRDHGQCLAPTAHRHDHHPDEELIHNEGWSGSTSGTGHPPDRDRHP